MSTIHEYAETFNEVVGDMIMFWKCMTNNDVGQAQIDHLEHDLYNWSIECEFTSKLRNLVTIFMTLKRHYH